MKKILFTLLIGCLSISLLNAKTKKTKRDIVTEKKAAIVEHDNHLETYALAISLAKYGYQNNSATALIQAAEIIQNLNIQNYQFKLETSTGEETSKEKYNSYKLEDIIAHAKVFSADNQLYLNLIKELESNMTRGAVGGPKSALHKVAAKGMDNFTISFYANERATIIVSGDGDTDLDLYVYDYNGNLVGSDIDYSDDCIVSFIPRWTGSFTIKVVNRGNVYNRYAIATN